MIQSPGEMPLLLTARQAAQRLSLSERTLWTLTNVAGEIPCVRHGRWVRYDPADLVEWIGRRKATCFEGKHSLN
jgi:excisionase family DNA binding protein